MTPCRLHVTGASGSGTTTLGRALATDWAVPHADVDDYFWLPTSPAYVEKRPVDDRLRLMAEVFLELDAWVLTGSVMGWGDPLAPRFDAVVFLTLDAQLRLARLHEREVGRYGDAIGPGGRREQAHREFTQWAAGYDQPGFTGRSRARHDEWLGGLGRPTLRLDSAAGVDSLVADVNGWLDAGMPG